MSNATNKTGITPPIDPEKTGLKHPADSNGVELLYVSFGTPESSRVVNLSDCVTCERSESASPSGHFPEKTIHVGRSRKGMEWDGVHGVWRPTPPSGGGGGGGVSDNGSAAVALEPEQEPNTCTMSPRQDSVDSRSMAGPAAANTASRFRDKSRGDLPDEEDEFNPPVDDDAVDTNDDDEGVLVVVREVSLPEREERKTALKEEGICHGADTMSVPHCHGEDSLYDGSLAIPGLAAINAAAGSELFHEKDVAESQVGGDPTTSKNPTSGSASSSKRTKSGRKKAAAATITPTPKPSTDLSMQQLSDSIDKGAFSLRRVLKGGDRVQLKMARLLRDDEGGRCILLVRSKLKKADGSLVDYTFTVNRWMKIIYDSQNGKGRYIDYKHICVEDTESVGELFRSFNVVEIIKVWRVDVHRDRRPPCFIGSVQEDEKQNT